MPKSSLLLASTCAVALAFAHAPLTEAGERSYDFDGIDDAIRMSHDPAYDVSSYTLEAWVQVDTMGAAGTLSSVINRWTNDSTSEVFGLWIHDDGAGCLMPLMATGGVDNAGFASGCFDYGSWHHVAAVYDASFGEERLYVDGTLVGIKPVSGSITSSSADLLVGMQAAGPARPFDGRIDEVRMFETARTGDEVAESYASCLTGSESGLVGYWRFDDDRGQSVLDDAPTGNDGMLGAGPDSDASDPLSVDAAGSVACPDGDADDVADYFDNCPDTFNPDQTDGDGDGSGDDCDPFPLAADNLGACLEELALASGSAACESDLESCAARNDMAIAGLTEIARLVALPPGHRDSSFDCDADDDPICTLAEAIVNALVGPPGDARDAGRASSLESFDSEEPAEGRAGSRHGDARKKSKRRR